MRGLLIMSSTIDSPLYFTPEPFHYRRAVFLFQLFLLWHTMLKILSKLVSLTIFLQLAENTRSHYNLGYMIISLVIYNLL
jgi:hypothetical protein